MAEGPLHRESETFWLWPENAAVFTAWQELQTQWRVGMGGATGMDYAGVRAYLDECGPGPSEERRALFASLRACEHACLRAWRESNDHQAGSGA